MPYQFFTFILMSLLGFIALAAATSPYTEVNSIASETEITPLFSSHRLLPQLSCASNEIPIKLKLYDTYGDGWNGNTLKLTSPGSSTPMVNAGTNFWEGRWAYYTTCIPRSPACFTVVVNGGSWQSECSWKIAEVSNNCNFGSTSGQGTSSYPTSSTSDFNRCEVSTLLQGTAPYTMSFCTSCQPGTFATNGNCESCPAGTFSDTENAAECTLCGHGKVSEIAAQLAYLLLVPLRLRPRNYYSRPLYHSFRVVLVPSLPPCDQSTDHH